MPTYSNRSNPSRLRLAASRRWYLRIPLKWLAFAVVTFFVLFPSPSRFARHLSHIADLDAMVEPDAPELATWEAELRRRFEKKRQSRSSRRRQAIQDGMAPSIAPRVAQREVERFVYAKVAYAWDWETWGSADYMPTVAEMFEQAAASTDGHMREDCDGRAVMAASLMRRLGYESRLVTDLRHVWVTTPRGEWMGPGRGKTIKSSREGNETQWSTALSNVPVSLSYGVAVFPLWREAIILATAILLILHRGMSVRTTATGVLLMGQGLLFLRLGSLAPGQLSREVSAWPAWIGGLHLLAGAVGVLGYSSRARRREGTRGPDAGEPRAQDSAESPPRASPDPCATRREIAMS